MARNCTKKKTLIHSPLLLRPNCERLKRISRNIVIVNQPTPSLLSFIRHNLVLLLCFMRCLANARQQQVRITRVPCAEEVGIQK